MIFWFGLRSVSWHRTVNMYRRWSSIVTIYHVAAYFYCIKVSSVESGSQLYTNQRKKLDGKIFESWLSVCATNFIFLSDSIESICATLWVCRISLENRTYTKFSRVGRWHGRWCVCLIVRTISRRAAWSTRRRSVCLHKLLFHSPYQAAFFVNTNYIKCDSYVRYRLKVLFPIWSCMGLELTQLKLIESSHTNGRNDLYYAQRLSRGMEIYLRSQSFRSPIPHMYL